MLSDALAKLLLSVGAAVVGGLIIRWWDRARALVLVKGFANVVADDSAPCPDSLREMTARSWVVEKLAATEAVTRILDAHYKARWERVQCENGVDLLPALRSQLADASTTEDLTVALKEILYHRVLEEAVVEGVERSILPMARGGNPAQLEVKFEEKFDKGRFGVDYGAWAQGIGKNLNERPELREKLDAWLDVIRALDKDAMLAALDRLPLLLHEAAALHQSIADATRPILQAYSQWIVRILIVNYGAKEMVIWPDATLVVRPRDARATRVACMLESLDDPTEYEPHKILGVQILAPSERVTLWGRIVPQQRELANGNALRAAYEAKTANARLILRIARQRRFRGLGTRSAIVPFAEDDYRLSLEHEDTNCVYPEISAERERSERLAALTH
jgi:hypothetical protein